MAVIPGGTYFPYLPAAVQPPAFASSSALNATAHTLAFCGRVRFNGSGTKSLERVQFNFGAVTKTGGSNLTVSHQGVSTAAGQPMRGNGTIGGSVAIANADAGFAANAWYRTGVFSAARTVSNNDVIAIVVGYGAGGRVTPDTFALRALSANAAAIQQAQGTYYNGTTYASSMSCNLLLEFSDGTFGELDGESLMPTAGLATYSYGINTVARDEAGGEYTPTEQVVVDGFWFIIAAAAAADYEIVLYSGTTAVRTVVVDATQTSSTAGRTNIVSVNPITLSAGTTYRLVAKATTTTSISIYTHTVSNSAHFDVISGGQNFKFVSRVDGGAFTSPVATERVFCGLHISEIGTTGGGNSIGVIGNRGLVG